MTPATEKLILENQIALLMHAHRQAGHGYEHELREQIDKSVKRLAEIVAHARNAICDEAM
jgi:hypothetical protein